MKHNFITHQQIADSLEPRHSRVCVWMWATKDPTFPKPFPSPARSLFYDRAEVFAWLESKGKKVAK